MRSIRNASRLFVAGMLALLITPLAACATIPDTGPVRAGLPNLELSERSVLYNPNPPQPGASPEDIVRGFISAASSSSDDYAVAREFLTQAYAQQWDPWLGVLVDDGTQLPEVSDDGVAVLSLRVAASVDSRGTLSAVSTDSTVNVQFELVEVGGQWRIASAPAGIILDRSTFAAVWTSRQIYFLSGDGRLVSETRWFLNRPTLSTQIIRELLEGPSESMATATRTAFPPGTVLSAGSVPVTDGTAVIDLSPELFNADDHSMQQLKEQIAASLYQVPDVQRFTISVHGTVIDQGSVEPVSESPSGEQQNTAVVEAGQFGVLLGGQLQPIEGLSEEISQLKPRALAVSADRSAAAVLHSGGASWVGDGAVIDLDPRQSLLVPSVDPLGYVWLFDPASPTRITAQRPGETPVELAMPWNEGKQAVAVRVSMGGNRIAVLTEDLGQSVVAVAGIARDGQGEPQLIGETASTVLRTTGAPVDLDWIGDTRVAVLSEGGLLGNVRRVTIGGPGQFPLDSGTVSGGVTLSGGSRSALLRVLDDQHRLFAPDRNSWQLQDSDIELLAKMG